MEVKHNSEGDVHLCGVWLTLCQGYSMGISRKANVHSQISCNENWETIAGKNKRRARFNGLSTPILST